MSLTSTHQRESIRSLSSSLFTKIIGEGPINWPALALARFALAFIVVAAHISEFTNGANPFMWISRFGAFNAIFGFLLISGLSIGKSIQKDERGYHLRRMQRIYPVYLASLALQYAVLPEPITWKLVAVLLANVFFLNQVVTDTSYVGPAWTLALEVWLYIAAPFFLRFSYKILLTLAGISFFSYLAYTGARTLLHFPYYSGVGYGFNLVLLSFIWIAGFVLAIFRDRIKTTSFLIAVILLSHWALTFAIQFAYRIKNNQAVDFLGDDLIGFLLQVICLAFVYYVVVANRTIPTFSAQSKRAANFLGNISYPLYLSHFSILHLCKRFAITNWAVLAGGSLLAATIIYWIFDFYSKKRTA